MEIEQGSASCSGAANSEITIPDFTPAEIMNMEGIFEDLGEDSFQKELCLEIATGFSYTRSLSGDPVVTWEQVQKWFKEKQRDLPARTILPSSEKLAGKFSEIELDGRSASSSAPRKKRGDFASAAAVLDSECEKSNKSKGKIPLDLNEMLYEAQSAKESGWYDVKQFRNFRYDKRGELEVLVRFKGFDREEDEWVNVRRQVRKRSIPLVPSECHMVEVGDDVMSYRVTRKEAVYYDARVVNIERKSHDPSDCSCVFEICYDHNLRKEKVSWDKLCRRL